ncbi:ABC transporter permease [Mucilaginibacter psychrotolerans]|uniref:ABC transporter permease n=1 Tax=Mucilaginibacter psychrotolerans TaxID=1524096 RepID=A0A4Y8SLZ3_9SPHI|nr:ABC transporter permease [Mucilaginibacter psychrotolerans]TFF39680.1 ABC transporter permease [Mucilaginibacter psychrotolerans]
MIRNYLRSALRNITRHKFISFINIFGLTVGLTCCLLILTYIINENSYDKYNANADDTYRVTRTFYSQPGVESLHLSAVAPPFGTLLQSAFPDIKRVTRVVFSGTTALHYKEKLFNEKGTAVADENFFDVFDVSVTKGNKRTALADPYCVMLTEDIAKKYFGREEPIGKTVRLDDNKHEFKVTGIFKPFPANAHMHPEILISFNTLKDGFYGDLNLVDNFGSNFIYTYLLFPKGYNTAQIESQLPAFLDKYVNLGGTVKTHLQTKIEFQKLTDIHLRSHLDDEIEQNGDIKRVYIFSAIALFILLIACINYMNLATARSVLRAKEIGIRKVIGAQRSEIISQFLSESVLITYVALVLAIALTVVSLPFINQVSGLGLSINSLLQLKVLLPVLALPFVIGLISGIYPALFMSSFIPAKVLKGMLKVGSGNISFRQVLVVLQFSISIILIVATAVVFQQLQYIQNKALGFNKDNIITMNYERSLTPQYAAFREDLIKTGLVSEIGRSSRIPSGRLLDMQGASLMDGSTAQPIKFDLKYIQADYGFIPAFTMKMAAGRNFSEAFPTDTNNSIINESAVKAFGWKTANEAIGKNLNYGGAKGKVIGVVKDFHFESLHQKIIPLLFQLPAQNGNYYRMSIKISGANPKLSIATVEGIWHKYLPETPFDYTFLDERFGKLYNSEQQQGSLFTVFSFIAIFIACLGLFGLSAFTITQRVKEIGVRKVLGATVPQIVGVLSRDFLKLVIVAAVIALPIAWYAMDKWLLDFEFHINISWWVLAMAGVVALIVAFVTISFQSVKAALANPVKSLRSE